MNSVQLCMCALILLLFKKKVIVFFSLVIVSIMNVVSQQLSTTWLSSAGWAMIGTQVIVCVLMQATLPAFHSDLFFEKKKEEKDARFNSQTEWII